MTRASGLTQRGTEVAAPQGKQGILYEWHRSDMGAQFKPEALCVTHFPTVPHP